MTTGIKEFSQSLPDELIRLNLTDKVTFYDENIPASRLFKGGAYTVTFGRVCQLAFGIDKRIGLNAPAIYREILNVVGQHNQNIEGGGRLTPIIVDFGPRANRLHYGFPIEQTDQAVEALKQSEERFQSLLPFSISPEEMVRLQEGDGDIIEKAIMRMYRLGLIYTHSARIPQKRAYGIIEGVANMPGVWSTLLSSEPPVNLESPFQRLFSVTLYRRIVDFLRQREKLKEFLTDADFYRECRELISREDWQSYFELRYGEGISNKEVSRKLGIKISTGRVWDFRIRNIIEEQALRRGFIRIL